LLRSEIQKCDNNNNNNNYRCTNYYILLSNDILFPEEINCLLLLLREIKKTNDNEKNDIKFAEDNIEERNAKSNLIIEILQKNVLQFYSYINHHHDNYLDIDSIIEIIKEYPFKIDITNNVINTTFINKYNQLNALGSQEIQIHRDFVEQMDNTPQEMQIKNNIVGPIASTNSEGIKSIKEEKDSGRPIQSTDSQNTQQIRHCSIL
jgi:hypothetical protein